MFEYVTANKAAKMIGISYQTLIKRIDRGLIAAEVLDEDAKRKTFMIRRSDIKQES